MRSSRFYSYTVLSLLAVFCLAVSASATTLGLGEAGNYAVLGLSDTTVRLNRFEAEINGNVGIAQNGLLEFKKGTINGDIYLDAAASMSKDQFAVHNGNVWQNQNLAQAEADAVGASLLAASLTPTQIFSTINSSTTITGSGGLNVININSIDLGNNEVLTLAGTSADTFVINLSAAGLLNLSANTSKILGSGVDASQILINVLGNVNLLKGEINGTILALDKFVNLKGTLNGSLVAGCVEIGDSLTLEIESIVNYENFSPVLIPEPATLSLLGLGLAFLRQKPRRQN
jgi:choice-of-anchor A domain-containing protein